MVCTMDDFFERIGKYWVIKDSNGTAWPVLYCPICGTKIDYGENKEEENKEV